MKNIQDLQNLYGKKILLRLDLNVPLREGKIQDETRINKILPIIKFLLNKKAKIIIISHVGRPGGKVNPELSLEPICKNLEKKINIKINLITDDIRKIPATKPLHPCNGTDAHLSVDGYKSYSKLLTKKIKSILKDK